MQPISITLYKHSSFFDAKKFLTDKLKNGPFVLNDRYEISLGIEQKKTFYGVSEKLSVLNVQDLTNPSLGILKLSNISSSKWNGRISYWNYAYDSASWKAEQIESFSPHLIDYILEEQEKVLKARSRKLAKERKERKKKEATELGISVQELKEKKSLERKSKRRKKKGAKITEHMKHTAIVLGKVREQKERLEDLEKLLLQNMELANNMQNPGSSTIFNGFNQKYTWSLNSYKDSLKSRIEKLDSED